MTCLKSWADTEKFLDEFEAIKRNWEYSRKRICEVTSALQEKLPHGTYAVPVGGSYGRYEASQISDFDYFCIGQETGDKKHQILKSVKDTLVPIVHRSPAQGGAFAEWENLDDMLNNIGGQRDDNAKITRRILFMLESQPVFNESLLRDYKDRLVEQYIRPGIPNEQIARFFLNDIIRYYRTICVDFEFKTFEDGKTWGDRNIKLVFSRKLLYFGGVLIAAETQDIDVRGKRQRMIELMEMPPLVRMHHIFGDSVREAFSLYNYFLLKLSDRTVRTELEGVSRSSESRRSSD